MSSVVFVLGAGASKRCGAPLMGNFLDVAKDLMLSNKVQDKREQFDRVFRTIGALQVIHSKAQFDLNNIESIYTALELGKIIQCIPGIETQEIPEIINSLKELIVKTLETTILFPTYNTYIGVPEPYEEFANLVEYLRKDAFPSHDVYIITFNYDIAVDMALFRAGIDPDYIIDSPPNNHNSVPLLKLHGSLNWATEKTSLKIQPLHLRHYLQRYTIFGFEEHGDTSLPIGSQLYDYFQKYCSTEVESEPVIVPPSWNKADYHQALSDVWASAAKHLSGAEYIFIIGYSLPETDSFFRHLYALGSVGKPIRKFIVFNPDNSGVIDARFRALLGSGATARYEFQPQNFMSAIPYVMSMFPKRS